MTKKGLKSGINMKRSHWKNIFHGKVSKQQNMKKTRQSFLWQVESNIISDQYIPPVWTTYDRLSLHHLNFLVSSVQSLSRVQLFATPWTAVRQAFLSITNSQSLPKLTSIESVMPSSHLILCRPLLLLPPILPSISLFQWVNSLREVAKVLEFQLQHQSLQWTPRTDLL